jgi:hypothetical protein
MRFCEVFRKTGDFRSVFYRFPTTCEASFFQSEIRPPGLSTCSETFWPPERARQANRPRKTQAGGRRGVHPPHKAHKIKRVFTGCGKTHWGSQEASGHDFSRAVSAAKSMRASAPEGCFLRIRSEPGLFPQPAKPVWLLPPSKASLSPARSLSARRLGLAAGSGYTEDSANQEPVCPSVHQRSFWRRKALKNLESIDGTGMRHLRQRPAIRK